MGKKRSQISAAKQRKTRDERKQAEREAERQEREVADGAGSLVEMKFKSEEMKCENDKSSDADNRSELVKNCEFVNSGTKPDESLDVSIKCETDLLVNNEDKIEPKLQAGEKSFACTQCDRKFAQRYQLDRHQRAHTSEKPIARNAQEKSISCPQCDKKFIRKYRLNEHMLVHSGEKPFACEACEKKFATKKRLMKHYKNHIGDKPFACDDCNKKFISKSGLNNHRICHTGEKLSCSDCNKKFMCKASLERHRNALHSGERPRPYACPECDKRYYEKVHMTEHYKSHTGERPYVCQKCGKSYARKNHCCFRTRRKTSTSTVPRVPDGDRPFVCPTCGKTYARKAQLRDHFRLHTDLFACSVCGKGFRESSKLKEHSHIHTGERPFVCQICGKDFALKVLLKNHLSLHTDEFACSVCGKKFGTSTSLKEHSYLHTGERPFICELCGRDFAHKRTFKTHLLLHKNEKIFPCSDCDMKFSCKSDLTVHRRIHGKKFSCDVCGKTFAERRYLLAHTRTHTGEKPYACPYCGKTFACKSNMDVHRRKHTGERRTPRIPNVKIFSVDSPTIESPSIECHVTKSSISDTDAMDSVHSFESEIVIESTGIDTGPLADDSFGEKSFAYSQCDEKFPRESDMHAHLGFHASERRTVNELCTEEVLSNRPPSEQVRQTERRDSTDSASTVDYHEMERLISEINKSVHSSETGIAIETIIDAGELKDVVPSTEPDQPVDANSDKAGTNVLGGDVSDLDRCPSPIHSECSSNVACSEGSPEHPEVDASEKLDVSAGCEMKFPDIASLYFQEVVHVINQKIYPCSACGMEFTRRRLLKAHQTSAHPGYKPFTCEVCKKTFAQKYPLKMHMQTHTRMKPLARIKPLACRKPLACELCRKRFEREDLLACHMHTHTRRKPYACRRCDMGFSAKEAFKSHTRICLNEPYFCDICSKQFRNKGLLTQHLKKKCLADPLCQTRTDEIPSATVCEPHMQKDGPEEEITVGPGKNSSADIDVNSDQTDLATEFNEMKRSKSVRKKIEPFACCYCGMRFSFKRALKSHKRIRCNENPYTCDVCMRQFVHKAQWISHNKKKCFFDQHRRSRTNVISSATVCVPHMQKDGPEEEITVGPGKNSSDPTDLATEFNELKRSESGIDENILSVDEVKKEYPDSGTEIIASVHNDMLSDLSVGTRGGEPHVDRNPISNNCGTDPSVNSTSQVSDIHLSQSNAGCSTTPFETFRFIKILKYPRREKTHECLHCDKKFTGPAEVIKHQTFHTGEKPFSCSVCEKRFSKLSNLKNHQIIHSSVKPLSCSDCGMEFRNRYKFSNHRKMKCAVEKPYLCTVCSKRFVCKSQLVNHFRNHTNEKPFVCHECDQKFTQAALLKQHIRKHTGENPFVCTVCDKKFYKKDHLNAHCRSHTGEKPFICEVCGKNFRRNVTLERHVKSHSKSGTNFDGEMSFMCEICGKNLSCMNRLKAHTKIHTDEKNGPSLNCADCDMKFRRKRELNWHRIEVHSGACQFSCPDCPASFSSNSLLTEHRIVNHAGDKAFSCLVCGKKFLFKGVLNRHMKHHTAEKSLHQDINTSECSFPCPDCPESFSKMCRLIKHRVIHAGDKAFVCLVCGEKFLLKGHWNSHMKSHERNFECPDCHKRFRHGSHLNVHRRLHSGEKPYACSDCDMRFTQKAGLNHHRRTNHTNP